MKGLELTVDKANLQQLLGKYQPLEVPLFQRPYSWGTDNWSDLWEDIVDSNGNDYLMGGIVLCGSENGTELIIDGQQRLSTITILSAACRDHAAKLGLNDVSNAFHTNLVAQQELGDTKSTPFLSLGQTDKSWFNSKIQQSPTHASFDPPGTKVSYKIPNSNRLLWRCYRFFLQRLEQAAPASNPSLAKSFLIELHNQLFKSLWFVVTRVPDDSTAFKLFEVLNDRGLDLTIADLIKNVVFAEGINHRVFEESKSKWNLLAERLDYPHITPFLRYHWMSRKGKKISDNELFSSLKVELRESNKHELIGTLKNWAEEGSNFAEIIGTADLQVPDSKLQRELSLTQNYGFRTMYSVLLSVWSCTEDSDHKLRTAAVRSLRQFLVKYSVFCGLATNILESHFARVAAEIRSDGKFDPAKLTAYLKGLEPSAEQIESGFKSIEPSMGTARLLLTEIENHISGDEKNIGDSSEVHVEHIYPQNPDGSWADPKAAFGDHIYLRDSLGNLTLLSGKKNRSASNRGYSEKAAIFASSSIEITRRIPSNWLAWSKGAIEERLEGLWSIARDTWNI
ncbi:DUF262 domain-containing HNH endonuclease family protein [bacterium BD-1]|nr:DUF262 domain-containing HNH endonuclease family protein [Ottowia caeni]